MDIAKLSGIVDAIEAESQQPNPSHANLARLCAMFMRATLEEYKPQIPENCFTKTETSNPYGVTAEIPSPEEAPKRLLKPRKPKHSK